MALSSFLHLHLREGAMWRDGAESAARPHGRPLPHGHLRQDGQVCTQTHLQLISPFFNLNASWVVLLLY